MRVMVRLLVFLFVVPVFAAPAKNLVRAQNKVKDSYIVVLKESERGKSAEVAADLSSRHRARATYVFKEAFPGFTARMTEKQAAAMLKDRRVASVEEDGYGEFATTQTLPSISFDYYGLDRIDQRQRGFNVYQYQATYNYCQTGAGVKAYVIDTGVWDGHVEFYTGGQNRVTAGYNFYGDNYYEGTATYPCPSFGPNPCNTPYFDNNSHGTAVASVIGGTTYGVAKNVTIVPLRVTGCFGEDPANPDPLHPEISRVLQALDYVVGDHQPGQPAVVNMSLAIGTFTYSDYQSMTAAINAVLNDGVPVVASAGNWGRDAGGYMPANIAGVITVGGSDPWDARWIDYQTGAASNWGNNIDLFAPASGVISAGMWSCDQNGKCSPRPGGGSPVLREWDIVLGRPRFGRGRAVYAGESDRDARAGRELADQQRDRGRVGSDQPRWSEPAASHQLSVERESWRAAASSVLHDLTSDRRSRRTRPSMDLSRTRRHHRGSPVGVTH